MPSLIANCLTRLVKEGRISQKAANDAQSLHDGMQGKLGAEMGAASADAVAALEAARVMGEQAKARKVSVAKSAIADIATAERQKLHPKGQVAGLLGMLTRDNFDWHPPGVVGADNVDTIAEVVQGQLDRAFTAGHEALRSTFAGLKQNVAMAEAGLREIFGQDTGNQTAKEIAKGWAQVDKIGTDRAKAGGRLFSVLDNWRVPQRWNPADVAKVKESEFVDDLYRELNGGGISGFMDKTTGGPADATQIPALLHSMYEDITTAGGKGGSASAFSPQMRVVRFADGKAGADSWLKLMDKYGGGLNIYHMMDGHIRSMAREIALVEQFGPNYRSVFRDRLDEAKAAEVAGKTKYIPILSSAGTAEKTFRVLTGDAFAVQNEFWAGLMSGIRGWLRGTQLGGAVISAVPGDSATMLLAASHNGISGARVISKLANTLSSDSPADRAFAARLGINAYAAADSLSSEGRGFMAWADPRNIGTKVSNTVIRGGGLNVWTNSAKRTFAMEFLGEVADRVGLSFKKLDPKFQGFLSRYQITPEEWDVLRKTPLLQHDGAKYFDIMSTENPKLGEKLMGGIISERKFGIVEPDARVQGILTPAAPRGSFVGETVASGAMYHSFSMSMANTHMMRNYAGDTGGSRAAYFAKLALATTMAGAAAIVARDIVYGKDPRRMNTASFWGAAILQGGGAGIFGDFFSAATNRSGGGLGATIGGPVGGLVSDTYDSFAKPLGEFFDPNKTFGEALAGAEDKWGANLARYVRRNLNPETFYTRLVMDRLFWDQVQSAIDPQYRKSWQRTEQNLKANYGNQFWWAPDKSPRLPNLGNVIQ